MSGGLDPVQEDLPLELPSGSSSAGSSQRPKSKDPHGSLRPTLIEQLIRQLRAVPWGRLRARATPVVKTGAGQLGSVARVAAQQGGTVARLAVKHGGAAARVAAKQGGTVARVAVMRGAPYTIRLARATAQISLIRALPLLIARTIHLFGFPAVVLRTALQYTIAHRAGLTIDEVSYFRVDDPAGYTVYEAPPKLGTAIAITYVPTLALWVLAVLCLTQALTPRVVLHLPVSWVTWLQIWLGVGFAAHALPYYEEAGPVAEQARVGVVKADPVSVFWLIPAQIVAVLTRLGGIPPAIVGVIACWWLAGALIR
jgi:hypothetical protein